MALEFDIRPYAVTLVGLDGEIDGQGVPVVGKSLMDAMWKRIHALGVRTRGINHWVYLPNSVLFTGVELAEETSDIGDTLKRLTIHHERTLQHVHRELYSSLPQVWPQLFAQLASHGESPHLPHLEVYGHWHHDPAQCETRIVIGLKSKPTA